MNLKPLVLLAGVAGLLPACGRSSYVDSDDAALGRVVVYRNGVAYYERRAHLDGDSIVLTVPGDKVDDFLKSLTVADAVTKAPLPVSFENGGAAGPSGDVKMTIALPPGGGHGRDVVLTYVTESPAWKPSYRVAVGGEGQVDLEGWAIVDNTSGEDWRAVKVGVGSSSALAFRYDLKSVRLVHRETLHSEERFAVAPPTGGSVFKPRDAEQVVGELDAGALGALARADDRTAAVGDEESSGMAGGEVVMADAARARPAAAPMRAKAARKSDADAATLQKAAVAEASRQRVAGLAESLRREGSTVTIEGFADAGEGEPQARALERAHALRNELIAQGVAPAQLQVAGRGVVAGRGAGVRLVAAAAPDAGKAGAKGPAPDAEPVGESHFESKTAMTVQRGTSAMVSILKAPAPGEIVYLYDAESERGDARFAFRSVLFHNPTDSTLESGPVTVYGEARFIGEGLTEAIPPHATAVVPYALDRQVVVERQGDEGDAIAKLVTLQRGVLTCEVAHRRTTKLVVTNRQTLPATVLLRHTTARGWDIVKAPKEVEHYGTSQLYRVALGPGEARTIEIEESTPLTRTVDLRTGDGLSLVQAYLSAKDRSPAFAQQMERLLSLDRELHDTEAKIVSLRERGDEFRVRMDELHAQILSLGLTKTGGSLTSHLRAKMKEISEKVQANTLAIVEAEERVMLSRVAFQDGLAELTLGSPVIAGAAAVNTPAPTL